MERYCSGHKAHINKITDHKSIDVEILAITGISKKITMFCIIIRIEAEVELKDDRQFFPAVFFL